MATGPMYRWDKHNCRELVAAASVTFTADDIAAENDGFYIPDNGSWGNVGTVTHSGIYWVLQPCTIFATVTSFTALDALLTSKTVVKLTGAPPITIPSPDPRMGMCLPWTPGTNYMVGDLVYNQNFGAFYSSLINYNFQANFQEKFEFGGITPPNQIGGIYTLPIGKQMHLHEATDSPSAVRKIAGMMYYARDTKTLWVHDGMNWERSRGFTIEDYNPARDDTVTPGLDPDSAYLLGDIVASGKDPMKGRYPDTNFVKLIHGIFRRDNVPYWNEVECFDLALNSMITVGPGAYFRIWQLTGALAIYNGIYHSSIQAAVTVSQTADKSGVQDLLDHIGSQTTYGFTKFAGPQIPEQGEPIYAQPYVASHLYMEGDAVYDSTATAPSMYKYFYFSNYNNYTSPVGPFDKTALFKGWTCLADLESSIDYPYRLAAYRHFSLRAEFPTTGQVDTIYIASDTGRNYYWDGYKYVHFSEDYPYLEYFGATGSNAAHSHNVGGTYTLNWEERRSEFETDNLKKSIAISSKDQRLSFATTDVPVSKDYKDDTNRDGTLDISFAGLNYIADQTATVNPNQTGEMTTGDTRALQLRWERQNDDIVANNIKWGIDFKASADDRITYDFEYSDAEQRFITIASRLFMDYIKSYSKSYNDGAGVTDAFGSVEAWIRMPKGADANPQPETFGNTFLMNSGYDKLHMATVVNDNPPYGQDVQVTLKMDLEYLSDHMLTGDEANKVLIDTTYYIGKPDASGTTPQATTKTSLLIFDPQDDRITCTVSSDTQTGRLASMTIGLDMDYMIELTSTWTAETTTVQPNVTLQYNTFARDKAGQPALDPFIQFKSSDAVLLNTDEATKSISYRRHIMPLSFTGFMSGPNPTEIISALDVTFDIMDNTKVMVYQMDIQGKILKSASIIGDYPVISCTATALDPKETTFDGILRNGVTIPIVFTDSTKETPTGTGHIVIQKVDATAYELTLHSTTISNYGEWFFRIMNSIPIGGGGGDGGSGVVDPENVLTRIPGMMNNGDPTSALDTVIQDITAQLGYVTPPFIATPIPDRTKLIPGTTPQGTIIVDVNERDVLLNPTPWYRLDVKGKTYPIEATMPPQIGLYTVQDQVWSPDYDTTRYSMSRAAVPVRVVSDLLPVTDPYFDYNIGDFVKIDNASNPDDGEIFELIDLAVSPWKKWQQFTAYDPAVEQWDVVDPNIDPDVFTELDTWTMLTTDPDQSAQDPAAVFTRVTQHPFEPEPYRETEDIFKLLVEGQLYQDIQTSNLDGSTVMRIGLAPVDYTSIRPTFAVDSIEMNTTPTQTVYEVGDSEDWTGLSIIVDYNDYTYKVVTYPDAKISLTGFDSTVAEDPQTITVTYTESGISKTTTFDIVIEEPTP